LGVSTAHHQEILDNRQLSKKNNKYQLLYP
jgi:hypothetical protein